MENKSNKNKTIMILIFLLVIILIGTLIYFKFVKVNKNEIINSNEQSTNENNDKTNSFLMAIEDVFYITNRGTIVTGRIERGTISLNDSVQIIGLNSEIINTTVTEIEMFQKKLNTATVGDSVGLLLKDIKRTEVMKGQVVAKPNSIQNGTSFKAKINLYSTSEGGRDVAIKNNHKTQFYFRTTDIGGKIELINGITSLNPGQNANVDVELNLPIAMEVGTEFKIRESGKVIGTGTIIEVKQDEVQSKPNTIENETKFEAKLYLYSKDEGGRQTPIFNNYKMRFYFDVADVDGNITFLNATGMISPGQNANVKVELEDAVKIKSGETFKVRQGSQTIGEGTITKLY